MAPSIMDINGFVQETMAAVVVVRGRGLNDPETDMRGMFTVRQQYITRVLGATSASVSLATALVAGYWFVRMRRSFRHHLIMLSIQSDMFKALWYLIFPLVDSISGTVNSKSSFCQTSGFFTAVGLEASDFAMLMIAVHSALCVFNPGTALGESGLYRYRYPAYVLWLLFPILMASLAFLNQGVPYMATPAFCYLPVRPIWYRLALSWIPRYIIFTAITVIYIAINIYVRKTFKSFTLTLGGSSDDQQLPSASPGSSEEEDYRETLPIDMTVDMEQQFRPPLMPRLSYHGLIPASPTPAASVTPASGRRGSAASSKTQQTVSWPVSVATTLGPRWENFSFDATTPQGDGGSQRKSQESSSANSIARQRPETPSVNTKHLPPPESLELQQRQPDSPSGYHQRLGVPFFNHPLSQVHSKSEDLTLQQLRKTRAGIQRQLRYLFIYPLVYMLMWIVPFISHCLQFSDRFVKHPSFVLNCFITCTIPLQCAVDCWVFTIREKPWKLIPGSTGTFWNSFCFWQHAGHGCSSSSRGGEQQPLSRHPTGQGTFPKGPGKSRAEMAAAAREAYRRRDEELQVAAEEFRRRQWDRKLQMAAGHRGGNGNGGGAGEERERTTERTWWEEEGKRRRDSLWRDSIVEEGAGEDAGHPVDYSAADGPHQLQHQYQQQHSQPRAITPTMEESEKSTPKASTEIKESSSSPIPRPEDGETRSPPPPPPSETEPKDST